MRRLRPCHLALSVGALLPLFGVAVPAVAEEIEPVAAVELLVKARVADARCSVLAQADRDELSDYVARGEIAAAQRFGAATAKAAVSAGRSRGESAPCDAATRSEIAATLQAARAAVVTAELRSHGAEDDASAPEPAGPAAAATDRKPPPASPAAQRPADAAAVGGYAGEAMAYYVERRCGHLSRSETRRFWEQIVARHKRALARYGAAAVRAALKQAEAAAGARRCNTQTAMLVKESFAALRR